MATGTSGSTTTNFDLILPGYEDDTDVDDLNENFKTIDGELYDATQAIAQNASAIQTVQDSLVHVKTQRYSSISVTTKSEGGAYYGVANVPSEVLNKTLVSITLGTWSGAPASFVVSLENSTQIAFCSDVSMTINWAYVIFAYR